MFAPAGEWSRDEENKLIELWETHSASQIAKELGTGRSRSAICGKGARLREKGVKLAPNAGKRYATPPPNAKRRPAPKEVRDRPAPVPLLPMPTGPPPPKPAPLNMKPCTLDEINCNQCHWPLWPDMPWPNMPKLLCGGPRYLGTPYCEHHARNAYARKEPKR